MSCIAMSCCVVLCYVMNNIDDDEGDGELC